MLCVGRMLTRRRFVRLTVSEREASVEFEQLRQLDAIAREGTFSAAAEALHTSQPSISRSMRALERELGCELFRRTRNRVELNDEGRRALSHARAILAEERRMRDAFDEIARRKRTIHVVSVAPAPVWRLTAQVVGRFPGTILTSELVDDEREVERRLFDRSADIVITRRPLGLPNLTCTPLMVENLFVYVRANDELAARASVRAADLDGRTFLMNAEAGFWGDVVRRAMPNARFIEQNDPTVLAQLLRTSDLPGFVTDVSEFERSFGEDAGRVRIPIQDADAHATFYAVALLDAPQAVADIMSSLRRYDDVLSGLRARGSSVEVSARRHCKNRRRCTRRRSRSCRTRRTQTPRRIRLERRQPMGIRLCGAPSRALRLA